MNNSEPKRARVLSSALRLLSIPTSLPSAIGINYLPLQSLLQYFPSISESAVSHMQLVIVSN